MSYSQGESIFPHIMYNNNNNNIHTRAIKYMYSIPRTRTQKEREREEGDLAVIDFTFTKRDTTDICTYIYRVRRRFVPVRFLAQPSEREVV